MHYYAVILPQGLAFRDSLPVGLERFWKRARELPIGQVQLLGPLIDGTQGCHSVGVSRRTRLYVGVACPHLPASRLCGFQLCKHGLSGVAQSRL